ncbi:hypothetical protein [Saliphagus sp. LR7]|uniref:WD40/YVTN/BNR-like repeat-containing protein n=1 Tax=Saliphagus sp. LR7 TaxID=2282654 RepID=UPI000DF851E6|nr:hypothetical protein [Saliphagus sp. LR7]
MTTELPTDPDGFGAFFRQYTRSWIHAVATAGLTAFGTLTFINRWFALAAISSYLLPPVVLYARSRRTEGSERPDAERTDTDGDRSGRETAKTERPDPDLEASSTDEMASASSGDAADEPASPSAAGTDEPELGSAADSGDGPDIDEDESGSAGDSPEKGTEPEPQPEPAGWELTEAPTEATLRDAAVAGRKAYATGEGGVVLASDDEWSAVLEDGPGADGNDLHGIDATDDGEAVWVAGESGAIGRIDAETGRHTDHTAPGGRTDNLAGIAVAGPAGEETILAIDGSGGVLRGRYDGTDARWEGPATPGSGSSLSGIVLEGETGYCCDTNDAIFETEDGGGSFEVIGPVGASGTLVAVAIGAEGPFVGSDDGALHRREGKNWTPERVADSLAGLACDGERTVVCTGSEVLERADPGTDWEGADPIGAEGLRAVAVGTDRALAVGENGTVVERLAPSE